MTYTLFEHFSHISLYIEISNTMENQQQQGLTLSEETLHTHITPAGDRFVANIHHPLQLPRAVLHAV